MQDVRPTTDDRPFFFHTTRLEHQFQVAFGRNMLFGNGLSALLTLMGISAALVALFIVGPLALTGRAPWARAGRSGSRTSARLAPASCCVEVALLQQFVLLLGHPVYSLTVTLFSLLLGTGAGSYLSRTIDPADRTAGCEQALLAIVVTAIAAVWLLPAADRRRHPGASLAPDRGGCRACLLPLGGLMGVALPGGMRLLHARQPSLVPWAWGMNGALSVMGATLAIFIAMNWGFSVDAAGWRSLLCLRVGASSAARVPLSPAWTLAAGPVAGPLSARHFLLPQTGSVQRSAELGRIGVAVRRYGSWSRLCLGAGRADATCAACTASMSRMKPPACGGRLTQLSY